MQAQSAPDREATHWTQPLQAAIAAFFVVSALVNCIIVFSFGPLYRQYYTRLYEQSQVVGGTQVASLVDSAMAVSTAITVVIALGYLALAALSYFRRTTWVFVVDMVVLVVAGLPTLIGGVISIVAPDRASLPPVFGLTQLMLAFVALSLFIIMAGLSLRYGVWAQARGGVLEAR